MELPRNLTNPANSYTPENPNDPSTPKPGPKGPHKHGPLVEAILANEAYKGTPEYRSPTELSERFQVHINTIYTYRRRLALKGKLKLADKSQSLKSFTDPESQHEEKVKRKTYRDIINDPDALVRSVSDEPLLGPLDRLRVLARLVRTGSPLIKISAIKAIEDLSKNTEGRIGPPPPLSEEDYVARMAKLMLGVGETLTQKALLVAFPTSEPETKAPLQSDTPIISETLGPPEGGLLDLSAPPISSGGGS
jgi:hypothetical protein